MICTGQFKKTGLFDRLKYEAVISQLTIVAKTQECYNTNVITHNAANKVEDQEAR